MLRSLLVLATTLLVMLLAAVGLSKLRDGDGSAVALKPGLLAPTDPGPVHVHGLGVNPTDGALLIATHTGMWRLAAGSTRAERIADSRQDTMGFTVVGPDRFLGSGHPDLRDGLPPLLGLIESTDGGGSWQPVSLLGEVDFHVLRSRGDRVYGYDVTGARFLLSGDRGRTWTEREAPAPLVDLAVDPLRRDHLVASSETGLFESPDGGRTWQALGGPGGYLAWPAPERLLRLNAAGDVSSSGGPGKQWREVGSIGGPPAALLARDARELFAALHDGTIVRSADGGASWAVRSRP